MIEPRLKNVDAIAGMPKTFFAFSIPITSAASATRRMNGHITRVSKIVSSVFSGDQLHQVITPISCGASQMPSNVIALMKTAVSVATLFASRHADSSPSTAIFFENVVMNAVESAPSANKSRSKFGRRNAIKNASRYFPAPNKPANTVSRIKPRRRLDRMASPTTPVARVLIRRSSAVAIGEERTASVDLRKQKLHRTTAGETHLRNCCSGACAKHGANRRLTQTPLQRLDADLRKQKLLRLIAPMRFHEGTSTPVRVNKLICFACIDGEPLCH